MDPGLHASWVVAVELEFEFSDLIEKIGIRGGTGVEIGEIFFESGDLVKAQQLHKKLFPLCRDMLGLATNPIPVKAAMQMLGRDTGELRMPMTPLTTDEETRLRATLVAYGLL